MATHDEVVDLSMEMLSRLGRTCDEKSTRAQLADQYAEVASLGSGQLYPELPSVVTFNQLVSLANQLAGERGIEKAYMLNAFWAPGTEAESVTWTELNGPPRKLSTRLALYSNKNADDRLVHFASLSYDRTYAELRETTQLYELEWAQAAFAAEHPGVSLRSADHRDFLTWYIVDLLGCVPENNLVLSSGRMSVPSLERRAVWGSMNVGTVCVGLGGRAYFDMYDDLDDPWRTGGIGLGLSAGFDSPSA